MHPLERSLLDGVRAWDGDAMGDAVAAIAALVSESEPSEPLRDLCRQTCRVLLSDLDELTGSDRNVAMLHVAIERSGDPEEVTVQLDVSHKAAASDPTRRERWAALGFGREPLRLLRSECTPVDAFDADAVEARLAALPRRHRTALAACACARFTSFPHLAGTGEMERARTVAEKLALAAAGRPPSRAEVETLVSSLQGAHDALEDDASASALRPFLYGARVLTEDDAESSASAFRVVSAILDAAEGASIERDVSWHVVEGRWVMNALERLGSVDAASVDTLADVPPREPPWAPGDDD